jgi:uncharacterized membrane protein (GlpM family)
MEERCMEDMYSSGYSIIEYIVYRITIWRRGGGHVQQRLQYHRVHCVQDYHMEERCMEDMHSSGYSIIEYIVYRITIWKKVGGNVQQRLQYS